MKCPFCKSDDTQVIDSRVSDDGESIRRRRRCTYIRFASVYKSFEGVDDFQHAIKEVQEPSTKK